MEFNIIGAGRLGFAIGNALSHHRLATLKGITNKHLINAQRVIDVLNQGSAIANISDLPPADITFITTPDGYIEETAALLEKSSNLKDGSIIVHCSGVLDAHSALGVLRNQGCLIASFHPLKAFPQGGVDSSCFNNCPCAVEGDQAAVDLLTPLFQQLGAQVFTLDATQKALYHAGAVIASNYLVTLADIANQCLQQAGVPTALAPNIVTQLMQSSLDNLKSKTHFKEALTGPLVRGDAATIERHLKVITDPVLKNVYQSAGLATLSLTDLDEETMKQLKTLLNLN